MPPKKKKKVKTVIYQCHIYVGQNASHREVIEIFDTEGLPYENMSRIVKGLRLKRLLRTSSITHLRVLLDRAESEIELPEHGVTRLISQAVNDPECFVEDPVFINPHLVNHIAEACLSQ